MTIDEAIKRAEEVAEEHTRYNRYGGFESWNDVNCTECAKEHRQLANWLKELKQLRKQEPCEDAISRQAAIDALQEKVFHDLSDEFYGAMQVLDELPSAQQWIPCDKGEPDEDMECWVTVKTTDALYRGNFTKRYGERRNKGFITSDGFMWWNTALAWMPIYEPEPYNAESDGEK